MNRQTKETRKTIKKAAKISDFKILKFLKLKIRNFKKACEMSKSHKKNALSKTLFAAKVWFHALSCLKALIAWHYAWKVFRRTDGLIVVPFLRDKIY